MSFTDPLPALPTVTAVIWLAVLFALASAATTALSTSTQHLSTGKAPDGAGVVGLMRYLVRRPEWLFALALGPVGFTFHVLALDNGPIGVVQPIAIMGIIFAVPIRAALARSWPSRSELVGVTVTALAIAVLLLAADVRSAHHSPDLFTLFVGCSAAAGGALVAIAAAGAVASPTPRAFLLGCASGVLFGLMAVLIEACQLYRDDNGLLALATSWLPYALVGAGLAGISVNQLAYRSARLSASMPVLNVVNCLLTLGFAHLVFGEVPRHTPVTVALTVAALAAIAWGLWVLCAGQRGIERFLSTADHAGAMSRLLTVVLALALLGVAAPGADAAARVRLTASDTTPVVGRPVALTADVGVRGRRVVFQKRTGQGWRAIGSDHSDRRGKATVRVRFNRVGPVTVRAVAANGADSLRLRVRKAPTVVTASFPPGPDRKSVV